MDFFRIPDPGSGPFFDEIFLQYNTGLLLKLTHKTINSMKKLCLLLLPFFYIGLGSGIRDPGSGMNKYLDPDPRSGIKHPGSATLE
jgi:hypothetical protein